MALSAALLLLALPLVAGTVLAGPGGSATAAAARARHEAVIRHWTPARMAAAVPRDFVFDASRGFVPAARPPGGGGTGDTTGASWPNGVGKVYRTVGKVYFEMGGSGWICSGVAATDGRSGYSVVQTAGHCAYDETADGSPSGFAENWLFIPQYDSKPTLTCNQTQHGCWTAQTIFVHSGYATAGAFNDQAVAHDWAYVVVGPGGHNGTTQLESLGTFAYQQTSYAEGVKASAFGYPAAGKYKGNDLTYCQGAIFYDPYNNDQTYGLPCLMTGGSSGGPWLTGFASSGDSGVLSSLNSYGYSGVKAMHGPKFNANTTDTFQAASSSGSLAQDGVIVP